MALKDKIVKPGEFDPPAHWYPKVLNASIHPVVKFFLSLSKERIAHRYSHLHPHVKEQDLLELLSYRPKHFLLAGTDLIYVTTDQGKRLMAVIENNSCPSGQKSMPLFNDLEEQGGYKRFITEVFKPAVEVKKRVKGVLGVVYDKNPMEASGYAAAMADAFDEEVELIYFPDGDTDPSVKVENEKIWLKSSDGEWKEARAIFRYLTQKPWNRLPVKSKTLIVNPIITCLAGGRNKMVAAKAYDLYNGEIASKNIQINTPQTIWDVELHEIPLWVEKLGGKAVVKVPYSNAGQGVFTIVNSEELEEFMNMNHQYGKFIVQALIGNATWSSTSDKGTYYHVGTVPDKKGKSYVTDIRMMIIGTDQGYSPVSIYSRRAAKALEWDLPKKQDSWEMLGTNLSFKTEEGEWGSDTSRLLLMDTKDFNQLGIGIDDLIEGYIQTVVSSIAIDKMAKRLIGSKGRIKAKLFRSLNNDDALINEILTHE